MIVWVVDGLSKNIELRRVCRKVLPANPIIDDYAQVNIQASPPPGKGDAKREVLEWLSKAQAVFMPPIGLLEKRTEKLSVFGAQGRAFSLLPATWLTLRISTLVLTGT
jgi:hypothetical protein